MPDLHVWTESSINGAAEVNYNRTVSVDEAKVERMVPPTSSSGWTGWAHAPEAEELVASIMKARFFPDEATPVQSASDLRRLGVTSLRFVFEKEDGDRLSMKMI